MKQVPIKLGPLTLLLTVISICLTTLAILNFTTARADLRLAERFADTVQARYALEAEGQEYLREMDQLSPQAAEAMQRREADEDGVIWHVLEQGDAHLRIGLRWDNGVMQVVSWRQEKDWAQDELIDNLWSGFGF